MSEQTARFLTNDRVYLLYTPEVLGTVLHQGGSKTHIRWHDGFATWESTDDVCHAPISAEDVRVLIRRTGDGLRVIAEALGYANHSSLCHCTSGRKPMPADKARLLRGYAAIRERQNKEIALWLQDNR